MCQCCDFRGCAGLAAGIAPQNDQGLQPVAGDIALCDKPGKMGDIRSVIEDVLNVDLRFGAHGKEPSGGGILLIGRDLVQRDRHGARFQGFDQMALFCGGKAARGLAGDLNIEVRGALAELAQKLGIKPEVQNMPLLGIAHMRMKAIGTRSMAG